MTLSYPAHQITPRRFAAKLGASAPRHWVDGDPLISHVLNTNTLPIIGNEA